jgi:hypothetical protein
MSVALQLVAGAVSALLRAGDELQLLCKFLKSFMFDLQVTWSMVTKDYIKSVDALRRLLFCYKTSQEELERLAPLFAQHEPACKLLDLATLRVRHNRCPSHSARMLHVAVCAATSGRFKVTCMLQQKQCHDAVSAQNPRWQSCAEERPAAPRVDAKAIASGASPWCRSRPNCG